MQLLPPGVCEAFFAGFCPVPNCPLRHESEIPPTSSAPATPESAPSPPQPAAVTAMDTDAGAPTPLETMEGVTARATDDASTPASFEAKGEDASHPTNAASEPVNPGEEHAAVTKKKETRNYCKKFVQNGYCQNEDCTLVHPDDDEDVDMADLEEDEEEEETQPRQQQETAAPVAVLGSSSPTVQGEMLPDSSENTPNGPNTTEIIVMETAPSPSRPDRSLQPGKGDNEIDIDDLPSEPDEELSPKKRSPSPSPDASSPKRPTESPPANHLDAPNTETPNIPGSVVVKPSPSPDTPAPVAPLSHDKPRDLRGNGVDQACYNENLNSHRGIDINKFIPPSQAGYVSGNGHRASPNQFRSNRGNRNRNGGSWRGRGKNRGKGRARAPQNATREVNLPIPQEDHPAHDGQGKYYCKFCDKDCHTPSNWKTHEVSKKHQAKVRNASFKEDNKELESLYRNQYGEGQPSGGVTWGEYQQNGEGEVAEPAEEEPDNANGDYDGLSYLANLQSSNYDGNDANEDEGRNNTNDEFEEDEYDRDIPRASELVSPVKSKVPDAMAAAVIEPVSDPTTPVELPVVSDDVDAPASPKPAETEMKPPPSTRVQDAVAAPPRSSSPPLPARLQSPTSPLSFDEDDENDCPVEDKDEQDACDLSEPRIPPTVNINIDSDANTDSKDLHSEKLLDSPPATVMPDVVSPRSVSEGTGTSNSKSMSESDEKLSPTKNVTAPNVGVVDAAVSSIERTHSEGSNINGRVPSSKPVANGNGTNEAKSPRDSRFAAGTDIGTAEDKKIQGQTAEISNGDKEDQLMNDVCEPGAPNIVSDTAMDTTNDDDPMETDGGDINSNGNSNMQAQGTDSAMANAAADKAQLGDGEFFDYDDAFNQPRQSVEQMHKFPNVFEPAEANEAPTIGSMNALRNIAMKGDRASQLAFKIMQEFLISPNLGIGQHHLKPFMRALEKVPQYLSEDGVPYSYWQHFHPMLTGQTLTPEQEYQYSVMDKQEEKAVELVGDNLRYLLYGEGTGSRDSEFMVPKKGDMEIRGRWPNSKHQFGADSVAKDPLFRLIRRHP